MTKREKQYLEQRVESMECHLQRLERKSRIGKLNKSDMEEVKRLAKSIYNGRTILGKTTEVDRSRLKEMGESNADQR